MQEGEREGGRSTSRHREANRLAKEHLRAGYRQCRIQCMPQHVQRSELATNCVCRGLSERTTLAQRGGVKRGRTYPSLVRAGSSSHPS